MKFVPNPRASRRKAPAPRNQSNLKLNLKELFQAHGIRFPYVALSKMGISHSVIKTMLNGNLVHLKLIHIEKICLALRCMPNDLFRWTPDKATAVSADHPMNTLNRSLAEATLASELSEMNIDHLRMLKKMAAELKSGK